MNIDIAHLANLSRLRFNPEDAARYENEMRAIIDMVSGLPAADGSAGVLDAQNPMELRPDVPALSMRSEDLLSMAPAAKAGCILIPKTVE